MLTFNNSEKENAQFRSNAGLKCYITRITDGNCCKWCYGVAGRYEYGEEPEKIYSRHDNCKCSVTYENGRKKQDVWSKKSWETPETDKSEHKPEVLDYEQSKTVEAENMRFKGVDKSGESGISGKHFMKTGENTVDIKYIKSDEYKEKFNGITGNSKVDRQLYSQAVAQLTHQNGKYKEDLTLINSVTGNIEGRQSKSISDNGVDYNNSLNKAIANNPPYSLISIHNHPTNNPPTGSDLVANGGRKYKLGVVVTHNGRVFTYKVGNKPFLSNSFDKVVDKNRSKGYNEYDAIIETLKQYERDYGIEWSER